MENTTLLIIITISIAAALYLGICAVIIAYRVLYDYVAPLIIGKERYKRWRQQKAYMEDIRFKRNDYDEDQL